MVGVDRHGFLFRSNNNGASGQVIGFSKQSAGALMDSGDGVLIKKILFNARDGQVMFEVILHSGKIGAL